MQKWNLLKKTAPCILSLAVAATSFPTAVMATDFDTAVVSEAEAQEADVEDFGAEEVEAAEDTTEEMTEDIQQDEAADDLEIQEDAVAEEADPVSDGEDEFSAGDDTEEAFSDESQLKGEYQYVYAGLTWGEYWAAEGVYNAGNTSSSDELDLKGEADKGAFDTVTRATANHGLHRGSYQTEATIIATDGTKFAVSYWKDNQTIVLTDGSEATWNRGFLTKDGKEYDSLFTFYKFSSFMAGKYFFRISSALLPPFAISFPPNCEKPAPCPLPRTRRTYTSPFFCKLKFADFNPIPTAKLSPSRRFFPLESSVT